LCTSRKRKKLNLKTIFKVEEDLSGVPGRFSSFMELIIAAGV
jgi:hypothetical protein